MNHKELSRTGVCVVVAALVTAGAGVAASLNAASSSAVAKVASTTPTSTNAARDSLTLSSPVVVSMAKELGVTLQSLGRALDLTKRQVNLKQPTGGFANRISAATFAHALRISLTQAQYALTQLAPTPPTSSLESEHQAERALGS